jgi:hypothetical protein
MIFFFELYDIYIKKQKVDIKKQKVDIKIRQ